MAYLSQPFFEVLLDEAANDGASDTEGSTAESATDDSTQDLAETGAGPSDGGFETRAAPPPVHPLAAMVIEELRKGYVEWRQPSDGMITRLSLS